MNQGERSRSKEDKGERLACGFVARPLCGARARAGECAGARKDKAPLELAQERRAMPLKVEVGPPQIAIHHGQTVLVTELDAQIAWPSERGLFFFDTRVLSSWAIYANGVPWDLLNGG